MDVDEALDFVRRNPRAVLATTKRDGSPQMSPVLAAVDVDGMVVVSTGEASAKTRNLRRDPRAWLCMLTDGFFGSWVQIGCDVEIISLPQALEPLVEYYRAVSGEHDDWEEYRAAMVREQRCLLRLRVTSAGPNTPH